MSGIKLIERLRAHGVSFERDPIRAHHQKHGQLHDTFLVAGRNLTLIGARYNGRRYAEVAVEPETGCRKLATMPVYVTENDDFSGYGLGLWLSSAAPKSVAGRDKLLFIMPYLATGAK